MKKLLPILLVVFGLLGGAGAGLMLHPAPETCMPAETESSAAHGDEGAADCPPVAEASAEDDHSAAHAAAEYVRLERHFVIPVISPDRVRALVVISLSIETDIGSASQVYAQEPKLRDAFLQVLFRHANSGGFDGAFTTGQAMVDLRSGLRAASSNVLGALSRDVLVVDVVRQDI